MGRVSFTIVSRKPQQRHAELTLVAACVLSAAVIAANWASMPERDLLPISFLIAAACFVATFTVGCFAYALRWGPHPKRVKAIAILTCILTVACLWLNFGVFFDSWTHGLTMAAIGAAFIPMAMVIPAFSTVYTGVALRDISRRGFNYDRDVTQRAKETDWLVYSLLTIPLLALIAKSLVTALIHAMT